MASVVPEHMAAASSSTQALKVWQVWPGTHQFFCDGRVMVGPDFGVTVFAFLLTTGTSVATWIFVCPSLRLPFTLCDVALYILTVCFMALTATTDPGIVPRCVCAHASPVEMTRVLSTDGELSATRVLASRVLIVQQS